MILSRQQFMNMYTRLTGVNDPLPDDRSNPLWIPETQIIPTFKCNWFVRLPPISGIKSEFWENCADNMEIYPPKCFMSSTDSNIEWWGFVSYNDAFWFLLRWNK